MKIHALLVLALVACDKPKDQSTTTATSASAPAMTSAPGATTSAPSAAPPVSGLKTDEPVNTKEVTVSIKDVATEPSKTVKVSFPVGFGPLVLRTETAGLAALSIVLHVHGELG